MSYIEDAFATFHDADGNPLDDGYIYIGTAGLDPETNPKSVYSDFGLTTSVAQPIRTVGGRAVADDGTTTINIYVAGEYSITIRDSDSTLVTVALTAEGIIDYMPKTGGTFTGSIGGTSATFSGDGSFEKLRLTGTGDASETSTAHAFQIGSATGLNVIIDNNEIIARDNGSLGTFYIGGNQIFVGENTSTVSFRGDVDFRSGSSSEFASGSTVTFSSGATVNFNDVLEVENGINVSGSVTIAAFLDETEVGCIRWCELASGQPTKGPTDDIAAAVLYLYRPNADGSATTSGRALLGGTWRCLGTVAAGEANMFMRVA